MNRQERMELLQRLRGNESLKLEDMKQLKGLLDRLHVNCPQEQWHIICAAQSVEVSIKAMEHNPQQRTLWPHL